MNITSFANQEVEVTAVYFRPHYNNHLESYPRRMVYNGQEYNFLEDSLSYLIKKGQHLIRLFDVSDGSIQYRLRLDEANHWTLVGTRAVA